MPDSNEAKKLWDQMLMLEAEKPGAEEDKEAFFENKGKQMAQLRISYEKATGVSGSDPRVADAISQQQTVDAIVGTKRENPMTRNDLNK